MVSLALAPGSAKGEVGEVSCETVVFNGVTRSGLFNFSLPNGSGNGHTIPMSKLYVSRRLAPGMTVELCCNNDPEWEKFYCWVD